MHSSKSFSRVMSHTDSLSDVEKDAMPETTTKISPALLTAGLTQALLQPFVFEITAIMSVIII